MPKGKFLAKLLGKDDKLSKFIGQELEIGEELPLLKLKRIGERRYSFYFLVTRNRASFDYKGNPRDRAVFFTLVSLIKTYIEKVIGLPLEGAK